MPKFNEGCAVTCGLCAKYSDSRNICSKTGEQRARINLACGSFVGRPTDKPYVDPCVVIVDEGIAIKVTGEAPSVAPKHGPHNKIKVVDGKKVCTKCGRELPIDAFGLDKRGSGGHKSTCKECTNLYAKEYNSRKKAAKPEIIKTKPVKTKPVKAEKPTSEPPQLSEREKVLQSARETMKKAEEIIKKYSTEELLDELKSRGVTGTVTYSKRIIINF